MREEPVCVVVCGCVYAWVRVGARGCAHRCVYACGLGAASLRSATPEFVRVCVCAWLCLVVFGCVWLCLVVFGCVWLCLLVVWGDASLRSATPNVIVCVRFFGVCLGVWLVSRSVWVWKVFARCDEVLKVSGTCLDCVVNICHIRAKLGNLI